MKHAHAAALVLLALAATASAQQPAPPAQGTGQGRGGGRGPGSASGGTLAVHVTDKSGNGLADVAVGVTGPVDRTGTTGSDGTVSFRSIRAGTYRLRFERDGFVTLERELVSRGTAGDVSVALNPAPADRAAPAPSAPPAPPAAAAPAPLRAVDPRTLSIPDFLERNLIGSEPQKTSLLACTDGGAARILQVRDPLNNQQNEDADQLLYVVAGSGIVRLSDRDHKAGPGWFALIPRGAAHSLRRDGRNPLITLMVAMGSPCTETATSAR